METPKWLTMAEYATAMNVSTSKVKRWKSANEIPFVQEGSIVRIPPEATDFAWLAKWREENRRSA